MNIDPVLSAKFDENKIGRKYNITLKNNERITGEYIRKTPSNNGIIIRLENNEEIPIQFDLIKETSLVSEVDTNTSEYILKGGRKRKRRNRKKTHRKNNIKKISHKRSHRRSHKRSHKKRAQLFTILPKKHSQNLLVDKEYKQFGSLIPGLRDL